jgi:hypothetical protein
MRSRRAKASAIGTAVLLGSAVLTGCGGDDEPEAGKPAAAGESAGGRQQSTQAVRGAYDKTAEADSAKMTMKVKAGAEGKSITSDGEGAIDFEDGDSTMTITAGGRAVEQRVVDRVLYQKVPGQQKDGKPWMKIDLSKVARQQGADPGQIGDPARSAAYAKAINDDDVSRSGSEKVAGVGTVRYDVSVDVSRLPGGERLRDQVGRTLPMRLWLDDDGRIRRQQIDMTVKAPASGASVAPRQITISTVMEFTDFGTDVEAEAPPAGQVADVTNQAASQGRKQS